MAAVTVVEVVLGAALGVALEAVWGVAGQAVADLAADPEAVHEGAWGPQTGGGLVVERVPLEEVAPQAGEGHVEDLWVVVGLPWV